MMMFNALAVLLAIAEAGATPSESSSCDDLRFANKPYTVCAVVPSTARLRLFLNTSNGAPIGGFSKLKAYLGKREQRLVFAMNAGMFHPDRRPVGLYIEGGVTITRASFASGGGNFGMLPNGVLCIADRMAAIVETLAWKRHRKQCEFATQSGPMLVVDGDLHPRFLPGSKSLRIRNGVGISRDQRRLFFVISNLPVNFHEFARLFRDRLQTPNALFLDGTVSRICVPALNRCDSGLPLGPIVAALAPISAQNRSISRPD